MSALESLGSDDLRLVKSCLEAAVAGPFFPDWEFDTLFGLSRADVRAIAEHWPANIGEPRTEVAVFNSLANLYGYPHKLGGELESFGLTRDALRELLDRLRSEAI